MAATVNDLNGQKPPPDPAVLTPNDLRRCKVALGGRSPHELLAEPESMFQVLILALALRDDPSATFEWAGDQALGDWFDMAGQSPPETPTPAASGSRRSRSGGSSSRTRPTASASAPSSAASTGSPATSTTS
jgi:hypothetical protein